MKFADIDQNEGQFDRPVYMKLSPGQFRIRILDDTAYKFYYHWIRRRTVKCLGNACPVCVENERIRLEHPENFRDITGYYPRGTRFVTNILDRTMVKVCPECHIENVTEQGTFPMTCTSCGNAIVDLEPMQSGKVKLLSRGKTLFEQLNAHQSVILDGEGNPKGLTNFDILLIVVGKGRDTNITAVPMSSDDDQVNVSEEDLFEHERAVIELYPEEILKFIGGLELRDIFASRRGVSQEETELETMSTVSKELGDELQERVDTLFSN